MKETEYKLKSVHLENERTIWIREPKEAASNVALFLDAELYRDRVNALEIIDALQGSRGIGSSLYVFVSTESVASRWVECECHLPFVRFIDEELFPWMERIYPPSGAARERVIVGLSYTGLAAAYVAMRAPLRFTKVIAQSGSFWWNGCAIADELERLEIKPSARFYLEVGRSETEENVRHKEDVLQIVSQIEGVKRFRDALVRKGCDSEYSEFDGGHDCADWARTLPAALRWALGPG